MAEWSQLRDELTLLPPFPFPPLLKQLADALHRGHTHAIYIQYCIATLKLLYQKKYDSIEVEFFFIILASSKLTEVTIYLKK